MYYMNWNGYQDLIAWKKAVDLAELIYRLTIDFPKAEQYGLVAQMRRSAVSISSNIAEGYRRKKPNDFSYFLRVALGSTSELETQLIIATRVGFLNEETKATALSLSQEVTRILYSLLVHVSKSKQ